MSGSVCTCGERFQDAEDWRDHMPCPGTEAEQANAKLARFKVLEDYIQSSVHDMRAGRRVKDFEHYVFEVAMAAVYGTDVWNWYNELPEGLDE